ncbi:Bug family tripartite tricarboxylate transporter substrate binding protein [Pigmentiphaga kullae]|uniref:Tripartite-type tricarboxylate transporter receptor subunit TctC n=1 Tax=Pigmentiphaga kullae TaxID=151784 RepID=A0A4Q7NP62_9BURK|nr:tripartite tricarboxylate transporter substrate binding protein [Pigmentiphaga kullae]RZS86746.1 tripartite-type tricarboxylate transporter receptor subunit TctC [Pigmentiphaga kullae]
MRRLSMRWLAVAVAGLACLGMSTAHAEWPDKPIRFIVPYPAGGGTDIVARAVGKKMAENLGQPVIVENRPGASTIIGTEAVARAEGDGYTIGLVTDSHALNPIFFGQKLSYDSVKDFAPVSQLVFVPFILVANPKAQVSTVQELIAAAKARPGKITYASIGNGTPHYLAMEWVKALADIDLTHVPYKGVAPALADVVGGQVDVMFTGMSSGVPHVRSGRLKGLAVSGKERSAIAPEIPTVAESGLKEFSFMTWYGVVAPASTPPGIVGRLSKEIRKALESPEVKDQFVKLGVEGAPSTPEEFGAFLQRESAHYQHIIKLTGAKGE